MRCADLHVDTMVRHCRKFAKKLGGDIRVVDRKVLHTKTLSLCPFDSNLAIDWSDQIVYITDKADRRAICGLVHEMAHVFASESLPRAANEWDFFGWEYCAAVKLGLVFQWSACTADYVVRVSESGFEQSEWSRVSEEDQDRLVRERVAYAIKAKMVSKTMEPLSVRT